MNSLDVATKEALLETVRAVAEDPAARCVVLTGTGRAFCVGQDLKEHIEILQSSSSDELFSTVDVHYNPIVTALATMAEAGRRRRQRGRRGSGRQPGLRLRPAHPRRGRRLQPRVRERRAVLRHRRQLPPAAAGRPRPGDRAALLPPHHLGRGVARRWASRPASYRPTSSPEPSARSRRSWPPGPTVALGAMRRSVAYAAGSSFEDALAFESSMMTLTGATADHAAAVAAFVAKEKPVFHGR